jgi:hypothetical protein
LICHFVENSYQSVLMYRRFCKTLSLVTIGRLEGVCISYKVHKFPEQSLVSP